MLTKYLQIAGRNLWRNKLFAFVNIVGLSLSMAIGGLAAAVRAVDGNSGGDILVVFRSAEL